MSKIIDFTERLDRLKGGVKGDDASQVLEKLLNLADGEMMVIFNTDGTLRYQIMPVTRFQVKLD